MSRLHRQMLEVRWELARDDLRARRAELVAPSRRRRRGRSADGRSSVSSRPSRTRARPRGGARRPQRRREELSRRRFAAQSAADRVSYRVEAIARTADLDQRPPGAWTRAPCAARRAGGRRCPRPQRRGPDRGAAARTGGARARSGGGDAHGSSISSKRQRAAAAEREATLAQAVEQARELPASSRRRARGGASAVREAERAVEHGATRGGARRRRARGLSTSSCAATAPRPAALGSLADAIAVAPGYELAVAAALDGRLGAALVDDRAAAGALLDRAGPDGGRVPGHRDARRRRRRPAPTPPPDAQRLADQLRGEDAAVNWPRLLLARRLGRRRLRSRCAGASPASR